MSDAIVEGARNGRSGEMDFVKRRGASAVVVVCEKKEAGVGEGAGGRGNIGDCDLI